LRHWLASAKRAVHASEENTKIFGCRQSFVAASPTNSVYGQGLKKIRLHGRLGVKRAVPSGAAWLSSMWRELDWDAEAAFRSTELCHRP
jgi:hypothetical protein